MFGAPATPGHHLPHITAKPEECRQRQMVLQLLVPLAEEAERIIAPRAISAFQGSDRFRVRDPEMRGGVHAPAVMDDKDLGRLMLHCISFGDRVGKCPVAQEVQVVGGMRFVIGDGPGAFQAGQCRAADAAPRAVLEEQHRTFLRARIDGIEHAGIGKYGPLHPYEDRDQYLPTVPVDDDVVRSRSRSVQP